MNPQLRETIGKALYNASYMEFNHDWNMLDDEDREDWMKRAERVVETYKKWIDDNAEGYLNIAGVDTRGEE